MPALFLLFLFFFVVGKFFGGSDGVHLIAGLDLVAGNVVEVGIFSNSKVVDLFLLRLNTVFHKSGFI